MDPRDAAHEGTAGAGDRASGAPPPGRLDAWAFRALLVLVAVGALVTLSRLVHPAAEPYPRMSEPAADFRMLFMSAKAFLRGVNPYFHDERDLMDLWGRDAVVRTPYPPTHVLLYVPLAYVIPDFHAASRVVFVVSLAAAAVTAWGMACVAASLERLEHEVVVTLAFLAWLWLVLSLPGTLLLDRGQSEFLQSALLWGGLLALQRGRGALAAAALTAATLLKGYPVLVLGAVLVLAESRREVARRLAASAATAVLLLGPAVRYLPDTIPALANQARRAFYPGWFNVGYRFLGLWMHPPLERSLPPVLRGLTFVLVGYTFRGAWCARRRPEGRFDAFLPFVTAALLAMVLLGDNPMAYTMVLVLPGVLLQLIRLRVLAPEGRARRVFGKLLVAGALAATLGHVPYTESQAPLATFGCMILLVACGATTYLHLRGRPSPSAAG